MTRRLLPPVVMVASMAAVTALWLDPPGAPLAHTSPTATTSSTSSTWPAPTTTTWTLPPTTTTSTTDPTVFAQWSRVAVCEEGGFNALPARGPKYYGWLGISAANWQGFGCVADGLDYYSVADNITCARRIQLNPPDQEGCGGGW